MHDLAKALLNEKKISASYTRVMIYEYLQKQQSHPTIDDIYQSLHEELPTLSKTTVYNIIALFQRSGLVQDINIGTHEKRYELSGEYHYHFYCTVCHKIYDIPHTNLLVDADITPGFEIITQEVNLKGICAKCKSVNLKK